MKLTVELTKEQHTALAAHAALRKLEPTEALVQEWWGRRKALLDYAEKKLQKNAQFRVYTPLALDPSLRSRVYEALGREPAPKISAPGGRRAPKTSKAAERAAARAEKLAARKGKVRVVSAAEVSPKDLRPTTYVKTKFKEIRILPDDSPEVACEKADRIEEQGTELSGAEILAKFGRDARGRKIK